MLVKKIKQISDGKIKNKNISMQFCIMLDLPNNINYIPKIVIDHQIVTCIFKIDHLSGHVRATPGIDCKYIFLSLIKKIYYLWIVTKF